MNFYLAETSQVPHSWEVGEVISKALCNLFPGAVEQSNARLEPGRDMQRRLFARDADLMCCLIYFRSLAHADVEIILAEMDRYPKRFYGKMQMLVVFPCCSKGVIERLQAIDEKPVLFEYMFIQSREGDRDFVLRECHSFSGPKARYLTICPPADAADNEQFFKQARLSQQEIEEFIGLDLDLKKHCVEC